MPQGDNNRKLSDEQRDEVVRLYTTALEDGTWIGVPTLARQFGVRNFTIQTLLKKRGIQTRTSKEAWANGKIARPGWRVIPDEDPPACKCGCSTPVAWNKRKWRWYHYAPGHYTQRGVQNPSWNGGTSLLPYPHDWMEIAARIRKRDEWTCQDCGTKPPRKSGRLHVHHIDRDRMNNTEDNLVALCVSCHSRKHADHLRPA
jgi:hypothetical protein